LRALLVGAADRTVSVVSDSLILPREAGVLSYRSFCGLALTTSSLKTEAAIPASNARDRGNAEFAE
jgi:hypothetical protein